MKYTYQARTKEGKIETGTIEASSKEAAAALLQKYSIFVTSLTEEGYKISIFKNFSFSQKVSKKDLAVFFRQLAAMLESRLPVVQSLTSLAIQADKKTLKDKIIDLFINNDAPAKTFNAIKNANIKLLNIQYEYINKMKGYIAGEYNDIYYLNKQHESNIHWISQFFPIGKKDHKEVIKEFENILNKI